jgi:HicB family
MDLRPYVETIHHQLMVAAEAGGDEARAVAERLTAAVDSTVRLALQDALVAAAEEITCELAPGSVELRLRGRDPEFVVRQPAGFTAEASGDGRDQAAPAEGPGGHGPGGHGDRSEASGDDDDGGMARVNLRLPDQLKTRAEQAAANERSSLNAWLVKAVLAALDRAAPPKRDGSGPPSRQRYVGWAR